MTPTNLNWYGLKKLGFDEESIGLSGDVLKDQIAIEALCVRIRHGEYEGGLGPFGHFKNYVDLLWNNPDSGSHKRFIWNPWANKMLRKAFEHKELSVGGPTSAGKCVRLDTPVRKHNGTVCRADELQVCDHVMGDDGNPRLVLEIHRGRGPMFKITPATGEPWYCTDNHTHVIAVDEIRKDGWWTGHVSSRDLYARQEDECFPTARLIRYTQKGVVELVPFTIEPSEDDAWVGFSVDGNHHFLLGDGTVTHNSDPFALYGAAMYSIDPTHTLVFIMSTTIQGAKRRIWKTLREYWESIPGLPGHALWSSNEIRGLNYRGDGYGQSSGIYLLASEQSAEKNAVEKMIGAKAPRTGEPEETFQAYLARPEFADLANHFDEETLRDLLPRLANLSTDRIGTLILVFDEMTGAAESILNAINTNLKPGNVGHFQIIGLGNPNDPYDPFGLFSKPKGGWDKVDLIRDTEWETETGGLCIRFNGEENPRITEGNERYSWMLRKDDIEAFAERYGKKSRFYHRMVLGTWCLDGDETGIYSPADIEMSGAKEKDVIWGYESPMAVSFLDPAFTAGGDLAWATFGLLGLDFEGKKILQITDDVMIKTDPTDTTVPINYQIVRNWRNECDARKVRPQCAAYDRTGGGIPFGDIVTVVWSPMVTGITSGGTASVRPIPGEKSPEGRPIRCCDRYANKATEIWYGAHPLFRSGQIRGVSDDLAKELCSRQHLKGRLSDSRTISVEGKRVYKSREGKSPDQSDSFLGLVDFCRDKHGLVPAEGEMIKQAQREAAGTGGDVWRALRERARRLTNARTLKRG